MDYKEKYEQALERAKELHKDAITLQLEQDIKDYEYIFPELQESEDERIRKAISQCIEDMRGQFEKLYSVHHKDAIAWLEKQKVTDEEIIFRPVAGTDIRIAAKQALEKIDEGKKVVLAFNGAYIPVNGKTVGEIDNEYDAWLKKQGENSVRWNENTDGNKPQKHHSVLMKTAHGIAEGEWNGNKSWIQYRWSSSIKDSDVLFWIELSDVEKQGEQKPMTEEFEHELAEICNQLLSEIDSEWMNNEILDCIGTSVWLNLCDETAKRYKDGLLKLAKQGEQKPAEWGEEDEKHIDSLLERLEGMCKKGATFTKTRFAISQDIDWLKSLKERIGG